MGSISEEVASSVGVQFVVGGTRRLFDIEGESDGSWRLFSDGNFSFPDIGSVQISGDDVGPECHEDEEGSHGRSGP